MVRELQQQAMVIGGLWYEVLVADDGSTDQQIKEQNSEINQWVGCRLIEREQNVGRAAIRNFLAREARGEYLLYLDSDVRIIRPDFVKNYVLLDAAQVALGGYVLMPDNANEVKGNLRYRYELACAAKNSVQGRNQSPYKAFRTSNFMIERKLMLNLCFDERIKRYGYEDVLFGKQLQADSIKIQHIDNAVALHKFDSNTSFLHKTNDAMLTLSEMADEMRGFTGIQHLAEQLASWHVANLFLLLYQPFSKIVKRNLLGSSPNIKLFHLYRLATFMQYVRDNHC